MSDCKYCDVENLCGYEYKPCDCVGYRKFKPLAKSEAPTLDPIQPHSVAKSINQSNYHNLSLVWGKK